MLYGAAVWDPLLIVAQIISIQCLWYLSLGLLQGIFLGPYIGRLSIAYVLDWRLMSVKSFAGWMIVVSNLVNAPIGAVFLLWVVERAKKCLDFGSTCYLLHLCACCWFNGFPASFSWWGTNTIGMLVMSLVGEWLCIRKEMQDIPLGGLRGRAPPSSPTASGSSPPTTPSLSPAPPAPAVTVVRTGGGSSSTQRIVGGVAGATPSLRPISVSQGNAGTSKFSVGGSASMGGSRATITAQRAGGVTTATVRNSSLQLTPLGGSAAASAVSLGGVPVAASPRGGQEGRLSRQNSRSRLLGPDDPSDAV